MIATCFVGWALVAASIGHVTQTSASAITLEDGRLVAEVRVAQTDLARKGEAFTHSGPDLERYVLDALDVRAAGRSQLIGRVASTESRLETFGSPGARPERWVVMRIEYPLAETPAALELASRLFLDVDTEHRHLVRVRSGSEETCLVLGPGQTVRVPLGTAARWTGFFGFYRTGIAHILGGIDHLLFLCLLLLLCRTTGKLVRTITAFSVTHGVTLSLVVLGFVHVSREWVECAIALSILYVAVEVVAGESVPTWISAFVFGLFHGLGFASGLAEMDWQSGGIVRSLLGFSLGVDTGQLLVVGALFPILAIVRARVPRIYPWIAVPVAGCAVLVAGIWLYARWPA
ncbi:MAG: HupE/UreJ family protein [Planctomycetes bacterium]|nr:HupE/UreJ family protein [Planctomycetota bacterium]MBI3848353.1 HupE/UreJ family protein [Planctomycetota bacterium]